MSNPKRLLKILRHPKNLIYQIHPTLAETTPAHAAAGRNIKGVMGREDEKRTMLGMGHRLNFTDAEISIVSFLSGKIFSFTLDFRLNKVACPTYCIRVGYLCDTT